MRIRLAVLLALLSLSAKLNDLPPIQQRARAENDAQAVTIFRAGLLKTIRYLDDHPLPAGVVPTADQRNAARVMWRSALDYEAGLESIRAFHSDYRKLSGVARERSFAVARAAFLAEYRTALDLIARIEKAPEFHTILNEPMPELGLGRSSYADFKYRFLHVARAADFGALQAVTTKADEKSMPQLAANADQDAKVIWRQAPSGSAQTLLNAMKIVQSTLWTPVPAGLAAVASGPTGPPPRPSLVRPEQRVAMKKLLQPGDIIFERREWILSDVGLPGFWAHAAMFIGTPQDRRKMFGDAFEDSLRTKFAFQYGKHLEHLGVIEAIGPGVVFNTFEHSADADFIAVVRPRLTNEQKATAITRAFGYAGRPYDFDFDFLTDNALVCTELVYKAYEGMLHLPVEEVAGRHVTPANGYVRYFDEQYDAPTRELDFVTFYDGHEHMHHAVAADVKTFRESWKRPRYHVVVERD